jgi:hypothetical protein
MPEVAKSLLQIAPRPEILGGVVSCAWSIRKALPDWRHTIWFCTAEPIPARTRAALAGCRLLAAPSFSAELLRQAAPDAMLLHNVSAGALSPALLPDGMTSFYYWHGTYQALRDGGPVAAACRRAFAVSAHLAQRLEMPPAAVWYQPVPAPPAAAAAGSLSVAGRFPADRRANEDGRLTVGRLCNPRPENWPEHLCELYRRLAARHPEVRWEFVGCPEPLQGPLAAACGHARFHPASLGARALLWRWDALLHHAPVTHAYGRVVCEAQQAGCVPIVDDRGGFVEQIEDRRTGFLCATPSDFSAALAALAPAAARRAIAAAAHEAGSARGSLESWRETFLGYCREVAAAASAASVREVSTR